MITRAQDQQIPEPDEQLEILAMEKLHKKWRRKMTIEEMDAACQQEQR
jgi:hypothetical protein